MPSTIPSRATSWARRLIPEPWAMGYKERLRASIGAFLGIGVTGLVCTAWAGNPGGSPLLLAPMGASAVLLFALPASPLAQPWSIIGGNLVAALIGVTLAQLIHTPLLAATLAVALAMGLMTVMRCVHPPSGAIALIAVLGGPKVLEAGYSFVLVPVLLNSVLLTLAALAFNNATGKSYPHVPHRPAEPQLAPPTLHLTAEDIDEALTAYGEALDISRADLEVLFEDLLRRAQRHPS